LFLRFGSGGWILLALCGKNGIEKQKSTDFV
jgi:hypothetical protein